MKKRLFTALLLTIFSIPLWAKFEGFEHAQDIRHFGKLDTLPPLEMLYQSIQTYYQQQANAELLAFQASTKGEWLKYVPNVGITYTVAGQPRPSVAFSTSVIYQARKDKQLRQAKMKSIESATLLLIQQEQRKLLQLVAQYEQALRSLELAKEIHQIEEQIFAIQQTKFDNLELTPLQFLPIKRGFLQKGYELEEKQQELELLRGEVLFLGKWGISENN